MKLVVPALVAASVASGLSAQSWDALVAARWPGASIQKVSEREFETFLAQHLAPGGDKALALDAFLTAQATAYGVTTRNFMVPTPRWEPLPQRPATDNSVAEAPEPNDDPQNGGVPTPMSLGDEGQGTITAGDEDWWQFALVRTTDVAVFTARGPGASYLSDTVLTLFDANGNQVASNDDYSGRGLYSQVNVTLNAGVYYAAVRAYGATQTGKYVVDVAERMPPFSVTTVAEGPEPNDDPLNGGTPTVTPCDVRGLGEINPAGDFDWWAFTLTAQTTVRGVTGPDNPAGSAVVDSVLYLFDSTGAQLAFDDDGGPGLYSLITQTLAPGTYYFAVGGYGTRTGFYSVDVDCGNMPQPVVAQYVLTGTGCQGSNAQTPALAVAAAELPVIGSTFSIDCTGLQTGALVVGNLGFTQLIMGSLQAPLDLAPFGAPGCTLYSDSAVLYPLVVDGTGSARFSLPIPLLLALEGLPFYQQVLALDPAANGLGLIASDALNGVLGRNL